MARWFGRYWIVLTVAATPLVYAPLSGRGGEERAKQRSLDTLAEVMTLVQKEAMEPPTPKQATHATIQGMLHTLDPHSNYMDEGEFRSLREDQRGTFFGIGAMIQQQPDGVVITSIVRGGPAEKMGLRPGDTFKEIDGKTAEGLSSSQVVQRLRGDKGTVVEVTVQRPGYPENLKFSITRAEIPSNSVYYSFMLTPTTGFITVKDFGETTSEEFQRAIANLKRQGMKELILDLRYNPGGLLDAAIGICRQLLGPNEIIVSQRGREAKQVSVTRTPAGSALDPFPLVVLINRGSASASEIVTGAVQDHDRGLVVGTTSWGKGLVQTVLPIGRSRGLALTVARYYTPSGRCIQRDYQHGLDDYLLPDDKQPEVPKGPAYRTDLNRVVYGGGGIQPDYVVDQSKLTTFVATLRGRYGAFFKFALVEKEKFGVKQGEVASELVLARFQEWLKTEKIPFTEADWKDPATQNDMRDQITYELQNMAFGIEAGWRYLCSRDPQVQKALQLFPEAEQLLKRKQLVQKPEAGTSQAKL
ncbi:S41 family peptidase [Holophaga foetida]|uniref:S41 family peptidase n=1 Tax=Holophaga foetida TaxID=35839 RepID=UPI000247181D|nr:S41 family peptidase [Holophaga foetida]